MTSTHLNGPWISLGVAALLAAGLSAPARAQWGSVHANNREHGGREEHRGPGVEVNRPREVRVEPNRGREREPIREVRHFDSDIDRHRGYFWWGYHPGMVIGALPAGVISLSLGGRPYYYYEGVYYQPAPSGFSIVVPPPGATVPVLPPGAEAVAVNGMVYYYAGGAYYVQQPNGYAVVPPPLGVTVTTLPPGAVPVTVNGIVYYTAEGNYYLPVMQNGMTVYMTARPG